MKEFITKTGLPSKKQLHGDLEGGFAARALRKIEILKAYNDEQKRLYETATAMGWRENNVLLNIVDLQTKLHEHEVKFYENREAYVTELATCEDPRRMAELKEKLSETIIDNPQYLKARELLGKEMTNVAKLGLDAARFQRDLEKVKQRGGDDELYTVNAEVVGDE